MFFIGVSRYDTGVSPSGKAVGSGPTIQGFESLHPSQLKLKGAILAFFRARSINNSTSHEENTNLPPFNL